MHSHILQNKIFHQGRIQLQFHLDIGFANEFIFSSHLLLTTTQFESCRMKSSVCNHLPVKFARADRQEPKVAGSVYFYAPNKGAAIFFTVAFASSGLFHLWQCL